MNAGKGEGLEEIKTPPHIGEESFSELREMSEEEVEARHDYTVQADYRHEQVYKVQRYVIELNRRTQERQTESMLLLTKRITRMTYAITLATLVNVGIAAALLYVAIKHPPLP